MDRASTLGNVCDNCPFTVNPSQEDGNGDGEGDRCDYDDGRILVVLRASPTRR